MKESFKVSRVSPLTGKINTMTLVLDPEDYREWSIGKKVIQAAMPYLKPEEREFLMTGYTADDWKTLFPPKETDK